MEAALAPEKAATDREATGTGDTAAARADKKLLKDVEGLSDLRFDPAAYARHKRWLEDFSYPQLLRVALRAHGPAKAARLA